MTPAPVRDLRETSHAREFFLKPFYFLCADFFENGFLYGPVAQLGAHYIRIVGVGSSNLLGSTTSEQGPLCSDVFLCPWQKKTPSPALLRLLSESNPLTLGFGLGPPCVRLFSCRF